MQDGTPSNALGGIDEQTVADTALVVEALAAFAGPPDDLKTRRERRGFAPVFHVSLVAGDQSRRRGHPYFNQSLKYS